MDDTLAKLAIKHQTSPIVLKILNGLSCDLELSGRSKIFVPGTIIVNLNNDKIKYS